MRDMNIREPQVTVHHFNPIAFYMSHRDYSSTDYFAIGKLLESRHPTLAAIDIHNSDELVQLLEFLNAL